MSGRGARPIEDTLRPLLSIVNALSREGAVIDACGVSYLLGLSDEAAQGAIDDVFEAARGADEAEGAVLPLVGDADEGIRLMDGSQALPALRMSDAEALAATEMLDALGVDGEALGGIRTTIEEALFPLGQRLAAARPHKAAGSLPQQLVRCLDALWCNRGLAFAYSGERDRGAGLRPGSPAGERVVEPLGVRYLFDQWVLDALLVPSDGGADDGSATPDGASEDPLALRRFFLVSRLENLHDLPLDEHHPELRGRPWDEGGRWVRLYFTDRSYFDASLEWAWAREVPRGQLTAKERRRITGGGCAVDVRHFAGSPYLARLISACAGACTTDDPALADEVRAYLAALPRA